MNDGRTNQLARVYDSEPLYTVSDHGRQHGPYSEAQLVSMRAVGQVSRDAQVYADGWTQWFPLDAALAAAAAASAAAVATPQVVAVQAEYAQTNVSQTHYVQNNFVYTGGYTSRPRPAGSGLLVGLGILAIVVGLLGSFPCPFLWIILVPVGIFCIMKGSSRRG